MSTNINVSHDMPIDDNRKLGIGVKVPGDTPSFKDQMLCMGSSMMEKFTPVNQICDHVVGIHGYADDPKRQVIAHHYCTVVNDDFRQCFIFDSDKKDAKLVGI